MDNNSKIWIIIKHEYLLKVKTKGFMIATFFGPLILVALISIPALVAILSIGDTEKKIAILDHSGVIAERVISIDTSKYYLTNEAEEKLKQDVIDEKIDGVLIIHKNVLDDGKMNLYTRGGGGLGFMEALNSNLSYVVKRERLKNSGASDSTIALLDKGIDLVTNKLTEEGSEKDYTEIFAFMGYILGFMIYMMMFMYGAFVMRGVIEEKANRIVEIIASSAKPFEIMFGKVVGIGAVGLTQVAVWIIMGTILMFAAGPVISHFVDDPQTIAESVNSVQGMQTNMPSSFELPDISIWIPIGFIFYFLAGYFIYSTLFAAIGSAVDTEQDAQQLQLPVTLPIIIPILFIFNIMPNPDGTLAVVLSLIPLFSPILMMVRVAATDVPFWQIATSIVLLIATFFGALWVAARIYRVGILMYGKKPQLKELIKWIRLSK